jgi:3D (Asp-Asp-Asp) domain-containing protein
MKKSIISFATVAALTGTFGFGFSASAQEVTVQQGDTLWGIANKHHISVDNLKEWNNLSSNLILPNDRLKVALTETYEVQKGDTLSAIATKFDGVTWKMIQEWNGIKNPELIVPGQLLDIYIEGNPLAASPKSVPTKAQEEAVTTEKAEQTEKAVIEEEVPAKEVSTEEAPKEKEPAVEVDKSAPEEATGDDVAMELTMSATAYTASCNGCSGITATGINLLDNPDKKVISVDPSVIPLGSKVYVEGYGHAIAGDTGGAIVGNKIDIFIPEKQDAINWGVRDVKVTVYK